MKIFGLDIKRDRPKEEREISFTSGKSPWNEMRFTEKPLELPTESTKDKGEVEDTGIPNYSAIDTLSKYDTMIDGTINIRLSAILSAGYRLVGKPSQVKKLRKSLRTIEFDQLLPQIFDFYLRYGNCFGNMVIGGGNISQLQLLPPHHVKIGVKGKKFYRYRDSDGKDHDIDWREILHFKNRVVKDYVYGRSDYDSALELLEDYARMNEQFRIMIEDTVAPILHARVGGDDMMTRPSPDSLQEIAEKITEAKKAGVDITTERIVELLYIQPNRSLNFEPFLQWFRGKILIAAMTPETKMMLRSDAAEGGDSQHQVDAGDDNIRYIQKFHIETVLNYHLVPMLLGKEVFDEEGLRQEIDYDNLARIEFNPPYNWKLKELNYLIKQYNISMIDDEIRDALGLPAFTPEQRAIIEQTKQSGQSEKPESTDEEDSESSQVRISEEKGE